MGVKTVNRPQKIDGRKARQIIQSRTPFGMFYMRVGRHYVGIDNSTGDAWTEDFRKRNTCLRWLRNKNIINI